MCLPFSGSFSILSKRGVTSESFLATSPTAVSAARRNSSLPAAGLLLLRMGAWPVSFRNLISDFYFLFLPQLLSHSLSNCPRFLLLFSPILMGLEDWWFCSETEEESGSADQPSAGCHCTKLLSSLLFPWLSWFIGAARPVLLAYLQNKHLPFASFILTNTYLPKIDLNTGVFLFLLYRYIHEHFSVCQAEFVLALWSWF